MEDRFKFRVWHKKRKKFYKVLHLHIDDTMGEKIWVTAEGLDLMSGDNCHISIQPKDCIVNQCTGLKDSDGDLIYEGDILDTGYGVKLTCKYGKIGYNSSDTYAGEGLYLEKLERYKGTMQFSDNIYYTIIGNIHENPELLNAKG